jgi:hypothetical protein
MPALGSRFPPALVSRLRTVLPHALGDAMNIGLAVLRLTLMIAFCLSPVARLR